MINTYQQEMVPFGQLKPADYNPREMPPAEMESLKRSLTEFGFVQPVIARKEDGLIVGGHQRLQALRELMADDPNLDTTLVPVVWVEGMSDDRTKLLNIALNRIHGEWDYEKLNVLLADLTASLPDSLDLSGFPKVEIDDILNLMGGADFSPGGEPVDPDEALRREARKFAFELDEDADAQFCQAALAAFGMTGPGDAAAAFLKAMQAAKGTV